MEEAHRARIVPRTAGARVATLVAVLLASDLTSWNLEPLQLLPTVLVSVLYFRRTRTLQRRGQPVPRLAAVPLLARDLALVLALNSPIDELGETDFFFVHMTQHILLGDLAPLCFVAGLTGPVLRPVLAIRPFDQLRVLTHPLRGAADLGRQPLRLARPVPLPGGAAPRRGARAGARPLLHLRRADVVAGLETLPQPAWFGTGWKLGYVAVVRLIETVLGNVFIWSSTRLLPLVRAVAAEMGDQRGARPEPRRRGDDGRGLARHARRARVALPAPREPRASCGRS